MAETRVKWRGKADRRVEPLRFPRMRCRRRGGRCQAFEFPLPLPSAIQPAQAARYHTITYPIAVTLRINISSILQLKKLGNIE